MICHPHVTAIEASCMQIPLKCICINIEMLWRPWMLLTQFQPLFHEKARTRECRMRSPSFHRYFCWTCKELRKAKITLLDMELAMLLHSCYFWVSNLAAYKKCSHNQRDYMLKLQQKKGDPLPSELSILLSNSFWTGQTIQQSLKLPRTWNEQSSAASVCSTWGRKSTLFLYSCKLWRTELEARLILRSLLLTLWHLHFLHVSTRCQVTKPLSCQTVLWNFCWRLWLSPRYNTKALTTAN